MEWNRTAADWNPNKPGNQWFPNPQKFPTGGFTFDKREASGNRYKSHGHGANPSAPNPSNSHSGPTVSIRKVESGTGTDLAQTGTWVPISTAYANDRHIPLINSPF